MPPPLPRGTFFMGSLPHQDRHPVPAGCLSPFWGTIGRWSGRPAGGEPVPPKPTGNVFEARGSRYARVPVGHNRRRAVKLPFCKTREEALVRSALMAGLVDKVRSTGHQTHIEKAIEQVANAHDDVGLATARRIVDGIVAGQFEPAEADSPIITIKDLGDAWTSDKLHPDHIAHEASSEDDK